MIRVRDLVKTYQPATANGTPIHALRGVALDIEAGESVALMGASGSGKSTLLHLLGGLDAPTSGTIDVDGRALHALRDGELSAFRRERLGFVFQFFHLVPTLSVLENVLLPVRLGGKDAQAFRSRAVDLLGRVGLSGRESDPPDVLSGGQQQRVALARALVTQPVLILADEPTGNLDSGSSAAVLELLRDLVREQKTTLVMATHSSDAAAIANRVVKLKDGSIVA